MAIDELIAAGIRPPQVDDPTTAYSKLLQIQAQRQQQQLGQQAMQSNAINLRKLQQEVDDERQYRAIVSRNAGGAQVQQDDPGPNGPAPQQQQGTPNVPGTNTPLASFDYGQTIRDLRAKGLHAYADKLAATAAEQRFKSAETFKNQAAGENDQAKADETRNAMIFNGTAHLMGLKDADERAAAYPQVRAFLHDQGHIDAARLPDQYPGDDWLKTQHEIAGTQTARDAEAKAARDAQLFASQLSEQKSKAEAEAAKAGDAQRATAATALEAAFTQGGAPAYVAALAQLPPKVAMAFPAVPTAVDAIRQGGMTAEQRTQATQADATLQNTKKYQDREIGVRQGELGVARQRVAIEQRKFEATFGSGMDADGRPLMGPDGKPLVSPAASAIANGVYDAQTARGILRRNPAIISQILQVDPGFQQLNLDKRQEVLREFTNTTAGHAGGQALALNTMVHHADLYLAAAEALKNGTFRPGNAVYNAVATAFGAAPPTNAALINRFFASETGKVATGGVPAEGEINGILKNLSTDGSPEQLKAAGTTLLSIAGGRMRPLQETADDAGLGKYVSVLKPEARDILSRRGFDPSTMQPAAPAGNTSGGRPSLDSFWKK